MKLECGSAEQTRAVAAALATLLEAGDVILLVGDLGTGKTTFAQGLARGLGVEAPVTSPSFTLVQEYAGRLPVVHVDVYRLQRIQELHDLGFEEFVDGSGVLIVEWGDVVAQVLPADRMIVCMEAGAGDDERFVTIETEGLRWRGRQAELERVVAAQAWPPAGSQT